MQELFDAGCGAAEYFVKGRDFPFPDRSRGSCAACGGDLVRHGFYSRQLVSEGFDGVILVRRYRCRSCGATLSLLPSFAHPRRRYGVRAAIYALHEFYAVGKPACAAARDFSAASGVECSRQLLLHWRKRLSRNLDGLWDDVMEGGRQARAGPEILTGSLLRHVVCIGPEDVSLKIFARAGKSFLTKNTIQLHNTTS